MAQPDEQRRSNRLVWAVVIVAALVAGAAAGLAKGFATGWPAIIAVIVGAVAWPIGNTVKAQLEQRQKNTATRRALAAGAADMRRVRDTGPADIRVHLAVRTDVPYIERDLEPDVIHALRSNRRVLIVGPSGVGKTSLALSCAGRVAGDFQFYEPADGKSLHQRLADGAVFDNALVWLDDLELFVTSSGLSKQDLETLLSRSETAVVVATIRTGEYELLQPNADIKPAGWEVPAWFGTPVWLEAEWSDDELDRLARTEPGQEVLPYAREYGLANYLAGAPLIERQLKIGAEQHPVGYAVVRATTDWQRTGIKQRLKLDTLRTLVEHYTPLRQATDADQQLQTGLVWATQKLTHTITLVDDHGGFKVSDLVYDHFAGIRGPIPEAVWSSAIDAASTEELSAIGYNAYDLEETQASILAWTKAAKAGEAVAMNSLAITLEKLDPPDLDGARYWYQEAANTGLSEAMYNLGSLLAEADPPDLDGARHWYKKAAEAGHPESMYNLGVLLPEADPPDLEGAARWYIEAWEWGVSYALYNLGALLLKLDPPNLDDARDVYRLAATWRDTRAMYVLAVMLEEADPPDLAGAVEWYGKTAAVIWRQSHSQPALERLAMYSAGVVLEKMDPPDLDEARYRYQEAANAGYAPAMYRLSAVLEKLDPPDLDGARHWYQEAANTDSPPEEDEVRSNVREAMNRASDVPPTIRVSVQNSSDGLRERLTVRRVR